MRFPRLLLALGGAILGSFVLADNVLQRFLAFNTTFSGTVTSTGSDFYYYDFATAPGDPTDQNYDYSTGQPVSIKSFDLEVRLVPDVGGPYDCDVNVYLRQVTTNVSSVSLAPDAYTYTSTWDFGPDVVFVSRSIVDTFRLMHNNSHLIVAVRGFTKTCPYTLTIKRTFALRVLPAEERNALSSIYSGCCSEYIDSLSSSPSVPLPASFPCPRLRQATIDSSYQSFCYPSDFTLTICTEEGRLELLRLGDITTMYSTSYVGARMKCNLPGVVMSSLKSTTALRHINLNNNAMTGDPRDFMAQLADLPALRYIYLTGNSLGVNSNGIILRLDSSVTVDAFCQEVGRRNTPVTKLGFASNLLTGGIPECLWNLNGLESLELTQNYLSGQIRGPPASPASNLKGIFLGQQRSPSTADIRQLTGTIFDLQSGAPNLLYFDVDSNNLYGGIPAVPSSAMIFNVRYNSLNGTVDPSYFQLTELTSMDLGGNRLTGLIPSDLSAIKGLTTMYLDDNQFSGPFPSVLPSTVTEIYALNNRFYGSIQTNFTPLTSLRILQANNNNFIGEVPKTLASPPGLGYLDLSNNNLTSVQQFADEVDRLSRLGQKNTLDYFSLTGNQITSLPDTLQAVGPLGNPTSNVMGTAVPKNYFLVGGNRVSAFPLWTLPFLELGQSDLVIDLTGNPFLCPQNASGQAIYDALLDENVSCAYLACRSYPLSDALSQLTCQQPDGSTLSLRALADSFAPPAPPPPPYIDPAMLPRPPRTQYSVSQIVSANNTVFMRWNETSDVISGDVVVFPDGKQKSYDGTKLRDAILWQMGLILVIFGFAGVLALLLIGLFRYARLMLM